jgi:hypothetical protein
MLFFAVLLGSAFLTAAKVTPSLVEYYGIIKASKRAVTAGSPQEIRQAFDRASMVEDISSITGKDLEISKDGEKSVVSFAYAKEVRLVGPVSLLIRYSGGSQ